MYHTICRLIIENPAKKAKLSKPTKCAFLLSNKNITVLLNIKVSLLRTLMANCNSFMCYAPSAAIQYVIKQSTEIEYRRLYETHIQTRIKKLKIQKLKSAHLNNK